MSDNCVSVRTITKRELNRNPALVSDIKPGESVEITDRQGALTLKREKKVRLSVADMEAQTAALKELCPPMDTQAFLREGEE
jgi:hypothetical protein